MQKFLTTAPVVAAIWFTLTAGILIEWNASFLISCFTLSVDIDNS